MRRRDDGEGKRTAEFFTITDLFITERTQSAHRFGFLLIMLYYNLRKAEGRKNENERRKTKEKEKVRAKRESEERKREPIMLTCKREEGET